MIDDLLAPLVFIIVEYSPFFLAIVDRATEDLKWILYLINIFIIVTRNLLMVTITLLVN